MNIDKLLMFKNNKNYKRFEKNLDGGALTYYTITKGSLPLNKEKNMEVNAIKDIRVQAGITQAQLSEATGVPLGTIRSWEQGRRNPSKLTISAIREIVRHRYKSARRK